MDASMAHSLILGHGLIGTEMGRQLPQALQRSLGSPLFNLPEIVYCCAGVSGFEECEGNPAAFHANVDQTLSIAKKVMDKGAFFIFISSRSIEWELRSAYSMHKALVEIALVNMGPHAIIRPTCKITQENVAEFCTKMIHIGENKLEGIHRIP